ncbi:MAG: helix-turn-helix transcriptional regulator [Alphaproteobacteria bacterium]|nr:helix-turn-helix transcriptional regulator [Alphaproteobacteria bacterium]
MFVTGKQIRAARVLAEWDRDDLATKAGVSLMTIQNIELDTKHPRPATLDKIIKAFTDTGIEFTDNEGVRFKSRDIQTYRGVEGFKKFLDNVYEYVKESVAENKNLEPVCASSVNDKDFIRHLGDYFTFHINRMNELKNLKYRILLKEKPASLQPEEVQHGSYREYRMRSRQDTANVPFYVYGDKLAILMLTGTVPEIVVISSTVVAQAYREIFNALWQMAKPFE